MCFVGDAKRRAPPLQMIETWMAHLLHNVRKMNKNHFQKNCESCTTEFPSPYTSSIFQQQYSRRCQKHKMMDHQHQNQFTARLIHSKQYGRRREPSQQTNYHQSFNTVHNDSITHKATKVYHHPGRLSRSRPYPP